MNWRKRDGNEACKKEKSPHNIHKNHKSTDCKEMKICCGM